MMGSPPIERWSMSGSVICRKPAGLATCQTRRTQENNYFGWRSLLGEEPGAADVSPYAAAARAADVSGLPPTYISVGGLDLFLEENMIYADRLSRAGVPVELHMYPRAYHGFYRATNARVTKQAEHDNREALRRFLHG